MTEIAKRPYKKRGRNIIKTKKLPEIKEKHRDAVKIADELQNLEI